jgi:uncharacterized protein (TIGR03084 family)
VRELSGWLRRARRHLVETLAALDPQHRVPWFGPDMSAATAVTSRLMETWAHGQDIADTPGRERSPTHRLRHVAHLGVRTFGFSFSLAGRPVPGEGVQVDLEAPGGGRWVWRADGPNRVAGPALDFCLVVTQRRQVDDTALRVEGPVARDWMGVAQAFAGSRGPGRPPVPASPGNRS